MNTDNLDRLITWLEEYPHEFYMGVYLTEAPNNRACVAGMAGLMQRDCVERWRRGQYVGDVLKETALSEFLEIPSSIAVDIMYARGMGINEWADVTAEQMLVCLRGLREQGSSFNPVEYFSALST